jgi:drug/metabolite transporter (DMT)-like permease
LNGKAGFAGGRPSAVAALVAAMTVWGSTFVVTERVLEEVGPFAIAALRFGIGLVSLLPFAYHRGFRLRLALEPTFLLFGLTGVALYYGFQNLAPVYTSAANAALISAGIPAAAALLAFLFIKEQMPRARLFGIALSVFGVLLVDGTVPSGGGSAALFGNALMVVAVLAYGAYAVQSRALRAGGGHPASVATAAGFAAGLLFLLPPAAALYVNLIPVVGLGFSVLVREVVGAAQLVGGTLAVAGVLLGDAAIRR